MLRRVREDVRDRAVHASDGEIGRVADLLFDDRAWTVRHLVVETGGWLGRKVLLAPEAVVQPVPAGERLDVALTRDQVQHAPAVETDEPVTRQQEVDVYSYYGWSPYWAGMPEPWGPLPGPPPGEMPAPERRGDPHLRSAEEVIGYHVHATDGDIGHVEDLIVDDQDWVLRYAIIAFRHHLHERHVVTSIGWMTGIDWFSRTIAIEHTRGEVAELPAWDGSLVIDREYEERLHRAVGREGYWSGEGPPPGREDGGEG